ncbi:MAG TPA: HEPN domain-containing protein [Candidatus Avalokitesvara rifleensis]|uniref:HEPN domain-containing protein n=1 Tax=Candidatus Avalokitesvara rifleensis TaxID=3367620 RepID=UPI00271278FB|nr:HEPN domain-containing protein [Candidatus Brocadiales bacterium]
MTSREDPLYPSEWLKIARKDWTRASFMLEKKDFEAVGFFLQQSLEKYLKAFLLQQGWKLRKIHELDALLDDALKYNPDLEKFRDLSERISGYYLVDRYPPLTSIEFTSEEIEKDLRETKRLIQALFPEEKLS